MTETLAWPVRYPVRSKIAKLDEKMLAVAFKWNEPTIGNNSGKLMICTTSTGKQLFAFPGETHAVDWNYDLGFCIALQTNSIKVFSLKDWSKLFFYTGQSIRSMPNSLTIADDLVLLQAEYDNTRPIFVSQWIPEEKKLQRLMSVPKARESYLWINKQLRVFAYLGTLHNRPAACVVSLPQEIQKTSSSSGWDDHHEDDYNSSSGGAKAGCLEFKLPSHARTNVVIDMSKVVVGARNSAGEALRIIVFNPSGRHSLNWQLTDDVVMHRKAATKFTYFE